MGQTADRRTEVFVSTTTKDLGPVRAMVTQALLTIGCHPVVQETFPPDYRGVTAMLEDKITRRNQPECKLMLNPKLTPEWIEIGLDFCPFAFSVISPSNNVLQNFLDNTT